MHNAWLDKSQAGIKMAGRNINKLRYADDTTLWQKVNRNYCLLMNVKEESEKADLKLNIQKNTIMASGPIISWQIDGDKVERVPDFILGGFKVTMEGYYSMELKDMCSLEEKLWQTFIAYSKAETSLSQQRSI